MIKMILQYQTINLIEGTYPKYWKMKKIHELKNLKFKALIKWNETSIKLTLMNINYWNMKAFFKENFKLFIVFNISGI